MTQMTQMENRRRRPRSGTADLLACVRRNLRHLPLALCAVVLVCGSVAAISGQSGERRQPGRLFPPEDLGLLEAPDRDQWQRPDQIMDALAIAEASSVADIGAGAGWFTIRLARRVGPNGVVYSQDVQQQMLAAISRRVQREGLTNVRTVLGLGSNPRLPAGALDAVLLAGVYHEIEDREALLANLARSLKPQGRIGVVDFKMEGGGPGPPADERVEPDIVVNDAKRAGLKLLRRESFLPYQYFLIFSRNDGTARP